MNILKKAINLSVLIILLVTSYLCKTGFLKVAILEFTYRSKFNVGKNYVAVTTFFLTLRH